MIKAICSFMLCVLALGFTSCELEGDEYSHYRDLKREVDQQKRKIDKALNSPLQTNSIIVVLSQNGDTIAKRTEFIDSINTANVTNITFRMPEEPVFVADKQKYKLITVIAILSIALPLVLIIFITLMIMRYVSARNRRRNAIIEKAIENNYQLPPAFYGGAVTEVRHIYVNDPRAMNSGSSGTENIPPVPGSEQSASDQASDGLGSSFRRTVICNQKKFNNALVLLAIGFSLFIFFMVVRTPEMAVIAGLTLILIAAAKLVNLFIIRS